MWNYWKNDITKAIWIFALVAVAAILLNWIRTPVLHALAENGTISRATLKDYRGVYLNDDWSHKGRPEQNTGENGTDDPVNGDENGDEPESLEISEYLVVDLNDVIDLFENGDCVFVDARSPEEYEFGHIPGAINWPYDAFDEYHGKYRDMISLDGCIVVYCENETCDFSADIAEALVWEYYQDVYRYVDGYDEWLAEFQPTVKGPEPYDESELID